MSLVWIKLRQYPKVLGAALLCVLVGVVWIIARIVAGRKHPALADDGQLTKALLAARDAIVHANAQAGVEVAVARTKDRAVQQELQTTLAIDDGEERRRKLAELGKRVRREE